MAFVPTGSLIFNSGTFGARITSPSGADLLRPELWLGGASGNTAVTTGGGIIITDQTLTIYTSQLVEVLHLTSAGYSGCAASDDFFFVAQSVAGVVSLQKRS